MRVLIVDNAGLMTDFAMRCQDAGHEVKWFVRKARMTLNIGKGLLTGKCAQVDDWTIWWRWADIIVSPDNVRYLQQLDAIRGKGPLIVAASEKAAALETDRQLGQQVMKRCGMPVPPYRQFSDYDSAIAFVKKRAEPFVCKPCGDEEDKSLSYVAKSPADLVFMLERWKKQKRHKDAFILQERVSGVEMAVGGWFGPNGFITGWHENFEFKKLMAGETGPATGEMGTVVRAVAKSKLADKVLKPVAEELHKLDYCGYVDVNCIIDDKGVPWPLEFTMRPGWPTFNIQSAMLEGKDPVEWLADLAEGRDSKPFSLDKVAIGVVLAMPDFPYSRQTRSDTMGIPIYGAKLTSVTGIHPCELQLGQAPHDVNGKVVTLPCLVTAGDYLLVASGLGETVREARRVAYRRLEKLKVPNSPFWRPDIGERLRKQLPTIQSQGYATGLTY